MALRQSDILVHNNPNLAVADSDFIKGGFRTAVNDLSELYSLSVKVDEPSASGQLKERSTFVYVVSESAYYELVDINNVANSDGWNKFILTNKISSITGTTNGLQLYGDGNDRVGLGGCLIGNTLITTNTYNLNISGNTGNISNSIDGLYVCVNTSCSTIGSINGINYSYVNVVKANNSVVNCARAGNVVISATEYNGLGGNVYICSTSGATYGGCYHNNYTNRSLVDKEYVDNKLSVYSVRYAIPQYPTYLNPKDSYVGVTGYTSSDVAYIYLTSEPKLGQMVTIVDLQGDALDYPIIIDGNGININGSNGISMINTEYGSVSLLYNGMFWSAVAFVN